MRLGWRGGKAVVVSGGAQKNQVQNTALGDSWKEHESSGRIPGYELKGKRWSEQHPRERQVKRLWAGKGQNTQVFVQKRKRGKHLLHMLSSGQWWEGEARGKAEAPGLTTPKAGALELRRPHPVSVLCPVVHTARPSPTPKTEFKSLDSGGHYIRILTHGEEQKKEARRWSQGLCVKMSSGDCFPNSTRYPQW
jgi:hypothetical protein